MNLIFGWIPDEPKWLRRLVTVVYVVVICACAAGLVYLTISELT